MRKQIRAGLRHSAILLLLLVTVLGMMVANLLPMRIRGCRPAMWIAVGYARLTLVLYGVKLHCPERAKIRQHPGLIFINHLSHLDATVFLSLGPMRSLAAAELRNYPLVGRIADAIGVIYVKRGDKLARQQARTAVGAALRQQPYPPLVIAPEGKLGPGDRLLPFRYGAFAIAVESGMPILLCTLHYTPLDVAVWHGGRGETLGQAVWRLGQLAEPMHVTLNVVETLYPQPGDDPAALAAQAQRLMSRKLGLPMDEPLATV